jgi:hypothetical protein
MNEQIPEGYVLVSEKELTRLRRDSKRLSNLEAAGVDNWEGYHHAFDDEREDFTDEEDWEDSADPDTVWPDDWPDSLP